MTNSNKDIEELEELLTELEGQEAQLVSPYSEDDDAVTQLMDAPLGDQEWMVQVTPLDRRMMSTDQLLTEFHGGRLSDKTLVWRGGMDDWLPIQRVEELTNAPRPAPSLASRMALGLPPPPAARPASQPLWTVPTSSPVAAAPLPPPPAAMPPVAMAPSATISNLGLPKPMAMAAPTEVPMSQSNTTRPVALDFNEVPPEAMNPVQGKRALVALGAVGIMAVFVTFYALSSGGDAKPTTADTLAGAPQAVAALQPAPAKPPEPPPAPAAAPKMPAPTPDPAPSEPSSDSSDSSEARQKSTAQAKYSLRSEYRKRSKSSASSRSEASGSESSETPERRATPAPRASAAEEETPKEPEARADDDADSDVAPKSTGKSNTFNREAAKSALDAAAVQAKNCKPPGGPVGSGRVEVRYEPSGKVANVSLLTNKFANTTTGSCVEMVFRRAKVPEFTGVPAVVVSKSFEIP